MEIAATRQLSEVLKILEEFTEITDKVKLIQMSVLMNSDKPKRSKEKFQKILESLPVDLVGISFRALGFWQPCGRQTPSALWSNNK